MNLRGRAYELRRRLLSPTIDEVKALRAELDELRTLVGQVALDVRSMQPDLAQRDLSVHSQFGEDGIIAWLVDSVFIAAETFVEIGVEDYLESNTRFLLESRNWTGLAIDGGTEHQDTVRARGLDTRHALRAASRFVTAENVNEILVEEGFTGDLGLLSMDIDGVDYWVLRAIEAVSPRIVVVEYNSLFGPEASVTVPYRPDFDRTRAHWSNLYFGASLPAIHAGLGGGYQLVGCNNAGNNAFFVRRDAAAVSLPDRTPRQAYVRSRFREYRRPDGSLDPLDAHEDGWKAIGSLPLVDVETGGTRSVSEVVLAALQEG